MIDDRELLERELPRFLPEPGMVDRVMRRRERKRRNQRVAAGVVGAAIAITVALIGARELLLEKVPAIEPSPTPSATTVDATVTYTGSSAPRFPRSCRLVASGVIEGDRLVLRLVNEDPTHEVVFWMRRLAPSEQPADLDLDSTLVSVYLGRWPTTRLDPSSAGTWVAPLTPPVGRWAVQCFQDEIPGPTDDLHPRGVVGPIEVG